MKPLNIFQPFVEALAEKVHDLGSDQLKVALTNVSPTSTSSILTDITEIGYTNLSSRDVVTLSSSQTSGTYKLVLQDLTLTASGEVDTLRYIVLFNDDAVSDNLIGYYDYGSEVKLNTNDTLVLDFYDSTTGALQLKITT